MKTITPDAGATVRPDAVVPVTTTVASASLTVSSRGISSNTASPLVAPDTMVIVKSVTVEKSVPSSAVPPATETVTRTSSVRAPSSKAARTVTRRAGPVAFSATRSGDAVRVTTVEGSSSSVIVKVTGPGWSTAWAFLAVPDTVTSLSGASTTLSSDATVTVPVLTVFPAAMVSVRFALSVMSPGTAGGTGDAVTVTVVASLDATSRVAVTTTTRVDVALSAIESGLSAKVTTGVASSSVIVTVRPAAGLTSRPDTCVAGPLTTTVRSGSSSALSLGARSNVALALAKPVGIVIVKPETAVKSVPSTAVPADTVTGTSTAASVRGAPSRVAVTVTVRAGPVASSATRAGVTVSSTAVDGRSSSVISRMTFPGWVTVRAFTASPDTVTCFAGPATALSTPVIVTVPVLSVASAAMVRTDPLKL